MSWLRVVSRTVAIITRSIAPGALSHALVGSNLTEHSEYTPTVDAPYDDPSRPGEVMRRHRVS